MDETLSEKFQSAGFKAFEILEDNGWSTPIYLTVLITFHKIQIEAPCNSLMTPSR